MSSLRPNHIRIRLGEHGSHGNFGDTCTVQPIHIRRGAGHTPHFAAFFDGGLEMDLTPAALQNFVREAQEAMAQLGQWPDCSGMFTDLGGGEE